MRVLAISDTHKKTDNVLKVIEAYGPFDMIFHMGDHSRDAMDIEYMTDCPVMMVNGNCDYNHDAPLDRILTLENKKILLTHGHTHHVKFGLGGLKRLADEEDLALVCYGHTHIQKVKDHYGRLILNPGSISEPRDGAPSFAILDIREKGQISYNLHRLSKKP